MIKKIFKCFITAIVAAFLATLSNSAFGLVAQILGYQNVLSGFADGRGWLSGLITLAMFVVWSIILFKENIVEKKED